MNDPTTQPDLTKDVIDRYLQTWNEPDATRRRQLIDQLWTGEGRYVDPESDATGPDAIAEVIAGVRGTLGDVVFELGEVIGAHHNLVLFTWQLRPAGGGAPVAAGYDAACLAGGRVEVVYGFFVPAAGSR